MLLFVVFLYFLNGIQNIIIKAIQWYTMVTVTLFFVTANMHIFYLTARYYLIPMIVVWLLYSFIGLIWGIYKSLWNDVLINYKWPDPFVTKNALYIYTMNIITTNVLNVRLIWPILFYCFICVYWWYYDDCKKPKMWQTCWHRKRIWWMAAAEQYTFSNIFRIRDRRKNLLVVNEVKTALINIITGLVISIHTQGEIFLEMCTLW